MSAIILAVALSACGSGGAGSYTDPTYHFTMKLPSGWSAPKSGKDITINGTPEYAVNFVNPSGFRVLVDTNRFSYTHIKNGTVVRNKPSAGCFYTCLYYRLTVSKLPALRVISLDASNKVHLDYVFVNGHTYAYSLEMLGSASAAEVTKQLDTQFRQAVRSFKIYHNA